MNTQHKIGDNVKQLQINEDDSYLRYFESSMTSCCNQFIKNSHIPFIVISTCSCGCGDIHKQVNKEIASDEQAIDIMRRIVNEHEREISKLN